MNAVTADAGKMQKQCKRAKTSPRALNPQRQTPESEGVLVSKQQRVHEPSQLHHQSTGNYSHAPSLQHKSALISAGCRIREYQLRHLLHLQTPPLTAQQSRSGGTTDGAGGATGKQEEEGSGAEKPRVTDTGGGRRRGVCVVAVLFALIRVVIQSERGKKKQKNNQQPSDGMNSNQLSMK